MTKLFGIRIHLFLAVLIAPLLAGCAATQATHDYAAALANPERPDAERQLDAARKPAEVLAFYGVKKGDRAVDIWAGRGYYTAILSQVVGPTGLVYSANPSLRPELAERWKKPGYENIRPIDGAVDKIALPQDGSLDFLLIHLNYHDLSPAERATLNQRTFAALKRGGVYGVVDHSAKEGSGDEAVKTLHRIDKLLVIKEVGAAGFRLAKEGNMLSKPEDKRDFNVNKVRNQDDRFVLAFQKP